jgi:hypothetical protein
MSVFRHWQLGLLPTILIMSLISFSPQATARGGTVSHPDLASTRHVKELPPEIVRAVEHWRALCGSPLAATSSFARYLGNEFSRAIGSLFFISTRSAVALLPPSAAARDAFTRFTL